MSTESSAQRYAIALYEMSRDAQNDAKISENAADFLDTFQKSEQLRIALSHPNIKRADRKKIIDEILANTSYEPIFANFLRLLVDRARILLFPKIVAEFELLRDSASGRVRASVYVAYPMNENQRSSLKAKIESQLGRSVVLQERIEPSIIGGFRLELQGRVYDNSIRRHLERLKDEMHLN